jgi:hypothetical protein
MLPESDFFAEAMSLSVILTPLRIPFTDIIFLPDGDRSLEYG